MNSIVTPTKIDYPNAVVMVPAVLDGQDVFYMSRIYEGSEQSTVLTIWGREIWGFPKVAADVDVTKKTRSVTSRMRALNERASADVYAKLVSGQATQGGTSSNIVDLLSQDNSIRGRTWT